MPILLAIWDFAKRLNLSQIALVGVVALALMFRVQLGLERRHSGHLTVRVNELTALRATDRASYVKAQADAADKNRAEVKAIEQRQEAITNDVQANLTDRLERLRRELRQGTAAPQGSTSSAGASPNGKSGAGTPQATGLCLEADQLLRAAENEERHDRLIDWVEQQLKAR